MKFTPQFPRAAAAAILLAATLAGCHAAPPLHYYALAAVGPAGTSSPPGSAVLIHVRHVGLPHEIDHLGLTHHTGATQLAISDSDQWTAPLDVLIQGTMTRDLGARLGYEHVVAVDALPVVSHPGSDQPAGTPAALDLDFVFLSADDSCAVSAQVNWTLSVPNGAPRRGTARLAAPATGCPAGLPSALSAALGELADQLVGQLPAS
jgi:uncharacterized lipoprotein YmbA